jgi:hypothetical protein
MLEVERGLGRLDVVSTRDRQALGRSLSIVREHDDRSKRVRRSDDLAGDTYTHAGGRRNRTSHAGSRRDVTRAAANPHTWISS